MLKRLLPALLLAASTTHALADADPGHPFILWTAEEAAALRQRIEADADAKLQYENMLATEVGRGNGTLLNLFKYSVMGDQEAGRHELGKLRQFIGTKPEPLTWDVDPKTLQWNEGMPSAGDAHMRDEQTLNTLRYDVLYDKLTPEEREGVEKSFKSYIHFHLDGHPPRHPHFSYTRTGWLPNMHWPRPIGTHLMAVAMQDEALIKAMFEAEGGFKWYFDSYLADGRFYMEEFGKYYSNVGTMIMYCEGLRRLGMDQMGWGYTGTGGANMKRYLQMTIDLGYPRTDIPGGLPNYRRVTMGDAKGTPHLPGMSEHSVVDGYLPNGKGGERVWSASRMNGPLPKMGAPFWFEAGHARYPDAGFDYFLAQMRKPGQDRYLSSLYFGIGPIDPMQVTPPSVESYLARERGFAFLRMDESPSYWEGPRPAVAQQFGMHYVHDCFSLLGYQAFNRPIYLNTWGGGKKGYAGGNAWKDSVRGHSGVVVDNLQAKPVDRGEEGLANHTNVRFVSQPRYKLSGARAAGVYPGVEQERVILLTDDYLLDVFDLASDTPRRYEWQVMGPGVSRNGWPQTSELDGGMIYRPIGEAQPADVDGPQDNDLFNVTRKDMGTDAWSAVFEQQPYGRPVDQTLLGEKWYGRGIGVRVTMLGGQDTIAFDAMPPVKPGKNGQFNHGEVGGFVLMARRNVPATTFVALHEPFENGNVPTTTLERLPAPDGVVAVRITGNGFTDVVAIALGGKADQAVAVEGIGEVTGHHYRRSARN